MKRFVISSCLLVFVVADVFACAALMKDGTRCKREPSPGSQYCWQHGGAQRKIRIGVDEDGNDKHMVRLNDRETNDLAVEIYNEVKNSLVIIKGKDGVGSGFVVNADGKRWIYTNEHVTRIGHPLTAVFIDGTERAFDGAIEVSRDRDLARVEFKEDRPALKIRGEAPSVDELAFVYGNSAGGDVITKIVGMVLGGDY